MKNKVAILSVLVITALIMAGCFLIVLVTQPSSVQGLQQFTASVKVEVDGQSDANPHYGIVGLKLPNDWKVDSVWFSGTYNDYCMFLHPDSSDKEPGGQVDYWTDSLEARYPSGADMQWLVYQSSKSHLSVVSKDTVNLYVKMTPGVTQGAFNLGYFVSEAALDFTDPTWYSVSLNNPITVTGLIPVELTSFAAAGTRGGVQINWETATESNNLGFDIERSINRKEFQKIGFVNGKGTTTQKSSYAFLDQTAGSGKQYYRLKQIDLDGAFKYSSTVEVDLSVPETFSLSQNYPNPFNPTTTLSFGLPVESEITLAIYNSVGELVRMAAKGIYQAGNHSINFNASDLTSGIYYYSLKAVGTNGNEFVKTAKMLLMK
jgi:hypothetical protein